MKKNILAVALVLGIANAVLLEVFEFVGINVTSWIWNDVFQTDTHRWLVLPTAWLLGLVMTAVIIKLHSKRIVPPESDLMDDMKNADPRPKAIWTILAIGAISLLAGASLGPEASLMASSAAIGAYAAGRWQLSPAKQLLILSSIGALLVAFLGSMVLCLIPLLLLFKTQKQQGKGIEIRPVAIIVLASLASYGTTKLIEHLTEGTPGYGALPTFPAFHMSDFITSLVIGFVSGMLAFGMNWLIERFYKGAKWLDSRKLPAHDWIVGLLLSTGLGLIYLFGGQTVEFSGSVGSNLLAHEATQYGALALIGLIVAKLLATAWSKGTGFRGGLVFPSIYIGIALGLLAGELVGGLSGSGALIGGMAGMIAAAVGSPIIASIFLIAILPLRLWPVACSAIVGTILFTRLLNRFQPKPKP